MATPELKAALNQSEPKPLNLNALFADIADEQPHEQLVDQLTQNLGQISKKLMVEVVNQLQVVVQQLQVDQLQVVVQQQLQWMKVLLWKMIKQV